ncbi:unannotated protein [freshwater metagenome]|uniref:Unannotated protein n=1 Tax=freshwater metagenome TaxID=449393 RepID=A0A6J6UJB4_9ZZZZ|nr:hypothetical protein [Actinomycetota bacterium]MSV71467.1 hypothetical protein [Actinomycetota bacterium]MSW14207.1 hypothetical protein [Actinomycetota bacterium]MSX47354.1 hypothetical protein [Actinomycetota bacterium]MSX91578.1 hypothetical protein [Actinomycetota bacterium]
MTKATLSKYALNNYRMASYLLLAIGLINLRYQSGNEGVLVNSLTVIIPGTAMLLISFIKGVHDFLARREVMVALLVIGLALVAWAITN